MHRIQSNCEAKRIINTVGGIVAKRLKTLIKELEKERKEFIKEHGVEPEVKDIDCDFCRVPELEISIARGTRGRSILPAKDEKTIGISI